MAHENGFKAVVAARGAAALQAARELQPHAITLDINLPDIDGWRVLDRLKDDLSTRHIPVQIITTEEERERGLRMGAMGVLTKPVKTKEALDETFARIEAVHRAAQAQRCCSSTATRSTADAARASSTRRRRRRRSSPSAPAADALAAVRGEASRFDAGRHRRSSCPTCKGFDLIDEIARSPQLRDVP